MALERDVQHGCQAVASAAALTRTPPEADMARARGRGDTQGAPMRDGVGKAGVGSSRSTRAAGKRASGQQSGSKRPAMKTGAAKQAPKKGTVEPKGTARPGAARKSRPGKAGGAEK